jgi:hypothetical protein
MGLIYYSTSLGLIVINLRGSGRSGGDPAILFHFVLALLIAITLYCTVRFTRPAFQVARTRIFSARMALVGLFCAGIPLLPGDLPWRMFNGSPPVISLSAALFMPVGLALFFGSAPAGREGLLYGLIMALGELLWVILFPLLGGSTFVRSPDGAQAFHLFTLNKMLASPHISVA